MPRLKTGKADRLYLAALEIREGKARGFWVPKMRYLAFRRYTDAMIDLAAWLSESNDLSDVGTPIDGYSAAGFYRRAYRMWEARAAQHLAMKSFNRNDLAGYRQWLRRAARLGDGAVALELRCFETRLPHANARLIRRLRTRQRRDEFG